MVKGYNLIVIGAGSAGMPCAIRAAQRGKKVLVIEKENEPGGTLHITAGHLSGAGSRLQQNKGIVDCAAEHFNDIVRISHDTQNPVIAQKATTLAAETLDWLEACGYPFHEKAPVIIHGHEAYSKPRTFFAAHDYAGGPITKPGKAVLQTLLPLWNECIDAGNIEVLYGHKLIAIIKDNKESIITSVLAQNIHTEFVEIFDTDGGNIPVVLTTGGYASNGELFSATTSSPERLISSAKTSSQGEGILVAMCAGAKFSGYDKHISTLGGVELEPGSGRADFWTAWARVSNAIDRLPREIYINTEGKRFINETGTTVDQRERFVLQQPKQCFYAVFDSSSLRDGPCIVVQWDEHKLKEMALQEKAAWSAGTIEALAEKLNIPVSVFQNTINSWNKSVDIGHDSLFGRTVLNNKVIEPPFYAVLVYAYSLISFGGIEVNKDLQVLHIDAPAFKNLYAAGEVLGAAATSGNAFCGGMLLTPALSFGKWLGDIL